MVRLAVLSLILNCCPYFLYKSTIPKEHEIKKHRHLDPTMKNRSSMDAIGEMDQFRRELAAIQDALKERRVGEREHGGDTNF